MTEFTAVFGPYENIELNCLGGYECDSDDDCSDMFIWFVSQKTSVSRRNICYSSVRVQSSDFKEFVEVINKLLGEHNNE